MAMAIPGPAAAARRRPDVRGGRRAAGRSRRGGEEAEPRPEPMAGARGSRRCRPSPPASIPEQPPPRAGNGGPDGAGRRAVGRGPGCRGPQKSPSDGERRRCASRRGPSPQRPGPHGAAHGPAAGTAGCRRGRVPGQATSRKAFPSSS